MKTLQSYYLGYTDWSQNINKVYEIHLIKDGNQYGVHKLSGRRDKTLVDQGKKWFDHLSIAQAEVNKIIRAKEKKGYGVENVSDGNERFTPDYVKQLITKAGVLCAEGLIERNHYNNIKGLLNSEDDKNQIMAESIIEAKEEQSQAA